MKLVTISEAAEAALAGARKRAEYHLRPRRWEAPVPQGEVLFENAQWAVSEDWLFNVAGPYLYAIHRDEVTLGDMWLRHMAEKNWVILELFAEAHEFAVVHHRARPS